MVVGLEIMRTYDYRLIESAVKRGTRFLILNADDMGMSTGVTDGIVRACEEGLATDISMIQTMPDSRRAAGIARKKGLNVGVHIDLTCQRNVGRPLLGEEVGSLTDDQGLFLSSDTFRERMLSGRIDIGEAEREIRGQVDQAIEWGLDLTHIDSNEGVHNYYPEILKIVLAIAREHDLPIRWPDPAHLDWLRAEGILTTDDLNYTFYGVQVGAKKRTLIRFLDGLRPGITEFIFHPAVADEQTRSVTAWERREAEMKLLLDPEVAAEIKERGIQPISFREIRDRQRDMRRRGVGRLKAGSARVRITPPFPTQMAGFFDRHDLSRGVHDDLYARGISLSDGRRTVVLISADLLYVDAKLVGEVRKEVSRLTGIGEDCVMVFATHTHSGPEGHHAMAPLMGFFPNPA
ncbi:ChbG/HpnK family deacetylase, partial [bacterium]